MLITLYDYAGEKTKHDIGNIEDIYFAEIRILSGDEVLSIMYKDGSTKICDSSHDRFDSHYEYSYNVYMPNVRNLFKDPKWLQRKDSYDYERYQG